MLPNFICIGAQKSGTTAIAHILEAHPQLFMAQPRETRFFYDRLQYAQGIQKYEIQYFSAWSGQAAVGEKCPEYLYLPEVAERLYRHLGSDLKLIVALRSPAQRAFSHYRHNLAMLRESRSFAEALEAEANDLQKGKTIYPPYGYLDRGYYAQQLERYFRVFEPKQFLIVSFEQEIARNQKSLADRLFDFLGIKRFYPAGLPFKKGHPPLENLSVRLNQNEAYPQKSFVEIERRSFQLPQPILNWLRQLKRGKLATRESQVSRIYNPSPALIEFARSFNCHKPKIAALPRERELAINDYYFRKDIASLQDIVPFKVDRWLAD